MTLKHEFNGKMLTAKEIAKRTKLPLILIRQRLARGKKGKALIEPKVSFKEAAKRARSMWADKGTIKRNKG